MWSEPALVDWCEPNYAFSTLVAEGWNTASSLLLVGLGVVGATWLDGRRFRAGMLGLAVVGAGSALFHGTLTRWAQAADELPMIWLGLACMWTLAQRDRPSGQGAGLAAVLGAFGAVFTLAYAAVPWAFVLFLLVYGTMVGWLAVRTAWLSSGGPAALQRAAWLTILAYLEGFFLFWVPEHLVLPCEHPAQALQLHAWWHVGAGVGTAAWWTWAWLDRSRAHAGGDP